ncbi:MAG: hypothetical protein AAF614_32230 [Chloroflexota bacterium]
MKRFWILLVLLLGACGGETAVSIPAPTPSVAQLAFAEGKVKWEGLGLDSTHTISRASLKRRQGHSGLRIFVSWMGSGRRD